jgi:hypothetical protein
MSCAQIKPAGAGLKPTRADCALIFSNCMSYQQKKPTGAGLKHTRADFAQIFSTYILPTT